MFWCGRTFSGEAVWLHMHIFRTSSPLLSIIGEKASDEIKGGMLPCVFPFRIGPLGVLSVWVQSGPVGKCHWVSLSILLGLALHPSFCLARAGCGLFCACLPSFNQLGLHGWSTAERSFWRSLWLVSAGFVVYLCYSSCSWGEQVDLARSCLAQVLSILWLQQKSHNGNWLEILPTA